MGSKMSESESTGHHILIAVVTGDGVFALLSLLLVPGDLVVGVGSFALAVLGASFVATWVIRWAKSRRSAWGICCIANGMLSAAVAARFSVMNETWSDRSSYMEDLDRAIGPLTHFVWVLAAQIGVVALILAAILFALSCWFFGSPHRKA